MHQVAVGLRHQVLDALLASGQHQLLELAMRAEQHLGRRCLEGDAPLGAMMVSPRWMPRPMPNGAASDSRDSMIVTAEAAAPSSATGRPCWKASTCRCGLRGSAKAPRVSSHASSGMLPAEVSVSRPPMVTPHSPRLIEYCAPLGGTGRPRSRR